MASRLIARPLPRPIDYFLVLDFEATCDDGSRLKPQEIIEFPVLKVNARTLKTEAEFHTYVRPTFHPVLTAFCTELTGQLMTHVQVRKSFKEKQLDSGMAKMLKQDADFQNSALLHP